MICQGEKYCDSNGSKIALKLMVVLLFVLVGGVALALDFVTLVLMFQVRHLCCCCWWILMCWCRRSFCCCCCRCWCCQGWCWWGETVSVEARVWVRCDGVAPARVRRGRPAFEGGGRTLRTTVGRNTECWTLNTGVAQHSTLGAEDPTLTTTNCEQFFSFKNPGFGSVAAVVWTRYSSFLFPLVCTCFHNYHWWFSPLNVFSYICRLVG